MAKKTIKNIGLVILTGVLMATGVATYMWFKPRRNVQAIAAFAILKVNDLTGEFNADPVKANAKYLSADGNSKILIIEGRVSSISSNQTGEKVIILKDLGAKTGVSATFTLATGSHTETVKVGNIIRIKGAITAGNNYDKDLDLYEYATLVQCDILK